MGYRLCLLGVFEIPREIPILLFTVFARMNSMYLCFAPRSISPLISGPSLEKRGYNRRILL